MSARNLFILIMIVWALYLGHAFSPTPELPEAARGSVRALLITGTLAALLLPLRWQLAELRAAWGLDVPTPRRDGLREPVAIDMDTLGVLNNIERRLNS